MRLILNHGNLKDVLAQRHNRTWPSDIGCLIRRLRELGGTSQCDLARLSAANLSYISSVESGMNNISIRKTLLLCNALRLPPSLLIAVQHKIGQSGALSGAARKASPFSGP